MGSPTEATAPAADRTETLKHIFTKMDLDGDGMVDRREFLQAMRQLGMGDAPASSLDGLFVSKNVEKLGMNKDAQYFWLAVQAAVVGGTLLL